MVLGVVRDVRLSTTAYSIQSLDRARELRRRGRKNILNRQSNHGLARSLLGLTWSVVSIVSACYRERQMWSSIAAYSMLSLERSSESVEREGEAKCQIVD